MRKSKQIEKTSRVRLMSWMLVLVFFVGCQSGAVRIDFDASVSFSNLQTFAWLEPPEFEHADPFADNSLLRKRMRKAVELALVTRGYRPVENSEEADFLATFTVVLDERIRNDGSISAGYGGYGRYGFGGIYSSPSIRSFQESTLVIDLVDPTSKALLWRGWRNGVVGTRDRQRSNERIKKGVQKILDRIPPDDAGA